MVVEEENVLAHKRVLYIGSAVTDDDPSGLAAVQKPLRERYRYSDHDTPGIDAHFTVYSSGLKLQYVRDPETTVFFPIKELKLSAAVKCVETVNSVNGERLPTFVSINSAIAKGANSWKPSIFTIVTRRTKGQLGYDCHGFITETADDALELVRKSAAAEKTIGNYGNNGVSRQQLGRPDQGFFYKGLNTQIRSYKVEKGYGKRVENNAETLSLPETRHPVGHPEPRRPVSFIGQYPPQVIFMRPPPPPPRPPPPPPQQPAPIIIKPIIRMPPPPRPPPQPPAPIVIKPIIRVPPPPPQPRPRIAMRPIKVQPVRPAIVAPPPKQTPKVVVLEEEEPPKPREIKGRMMVKSRSPSPVYVLKRPVEQKAIMYPARARSLSHSPTRDYRMINDYVSEDNYGRNRRYIPSREKSRHDVFSRRKSRKEHQMTSNPIYGYPPIAPIPVIYQARSSSVPRTRSKSPRKHKKHRRHRSGSKHKRRPASTSSATSSTSSSSSSSSASSIRRSRQPYTEYPTLQMDYADRRYYDNEVVSGRYLRKESRRTGNIPVAVNRGNDDLVVMTPGYDTEVYPVNSMDEAVHVIVEQSPDYDTYRKRHQPTAIVYEMDGHDGGYRRARVRSLSGSSTSPYSD